MADLDPVAGEELYQFNSVGKLGNSFSDYLSIPFSDKRDLVQVLMRIVLKKSLLPLLIWLLLI